MSISFWRRWLIVVTIAVIVYGLALMLAPQVMHGLFNTLFFASSDVVQQFGEQASAFITLVYGVLGAVIIGWMVALLSIIWGMAQNPRSAWNTLMLSVVVWYALDTGMSLLIGSVSHAVFNTLFLVMFAVPLVGIYRQR